MQKQGTIWKEIDAEGWQLLYSVNLRRLGRTRNGYHDLRLGRTLFVKWDGSKYVSFEDTDYKELSPSLFDVKDEEDSEILWMLRYIGWKDFTFEPQWISPSPKLYPWINVVKDDVEHVEWITEHKGGVWGRNGDRAFLLLPRTSYLGAEEIKIEGEWLIIYGDSYVSGCEEHSEIGRYQLHSHQMKVGRCAEIPFSAN